LRSTAVGRTITIVRVLNEIILGNASPQELRDQVEGRMVKETSRHGKYVGLHLSSGKVLVLHFGMTGSIQRLGTGSDPRYSNMIFYLDNGNRLAFVCMRLLCRAYLADDMPSFVRWKRLGPDALDGLTWEYFENGLANRSAKIKQVLLDQHFTAGIGNIYADEILYQSRINPIRRVGELSLDDRKGIFDQIGNVLGRAVDAGSDWDRMPDGFLLHDRGPHGRCPECCSGLESVKVGGRTSYFCPVCQPV